MISVGINGFGRIGKSIFFQLLDDTNVSICAVNAPQLEMKYVHQYLLYDSVHKYSRDFEFKIVDEETFEVSKGGKKHTIHLFRDRDAKNLTWKKYGIEILMECTGSYLTTEKCKEHDVDFIIMSAPAKDKTNTYVYGVNHKEYQGESIISSASCTTNCITPVLKWFDDNLKIKEGNFTTIHATTASQYTVDILNKNARTNRSILNNIIPHTTGASSAISAVIPSLKGKINGTSLRVPVSNVSLVDLNIECEKTDITFDEVMNQIRDIQDERKDILQVTKDTVVSCDFLTTTAPSIIDSKASIDLGPGKFKLMIWYDNEWSYSSQMIRLMNHVYQYHHQSSIEKYSVQNLSLEGKKIILRVDMNVPIQGGVVSDDYRVTSSLPTIKEILKKGVERLVIITHLGRPKEDENGNIIRDSKSSTKILKPILEKYLGEPIGFIENIRDDISKHKERVCLLENIRYERWETKYEKLKNENEEGFMEFKEKMNELGDVYINDAFGCSHRRHFSICGMYENKIVGIGYLIQKELISLEEIMKNPHKKKILAIVGGSKIDDKVPMLVSLSSKVDTIYLGGGIMSSLFKEMNDESPKYKKILEEISIKTKLFKMKDGVGRFGLLEWNEEYQSMKNEKRDLNHLINETTEIYDIGTKSLIELMNLINEHDIIFWNGTMGWIEKGFTQGSELLAQILKNSGKKVIIGGGDTGGFVNQLGIDSFYHISTGGGASIEYISEGHLVGTDYFVSS